jgi:hypothetical protein
VSNDRPGIVIPSVPIPPGTPFSEREAVVHRGLLHANGYDTAATYRRATASQEPTLRAAAFELLSHDRWQKTSRCSRRASRIQTQRFAVRGVRRRAAPAWPGRADVARGRRWLEFGDTSPLIAAVALARLGDASGFPAVTAGLARPDSRISAVGCLFDFALLANVWPYFASALGDSDPTIRELALVQLEELRDRRSAGILEQFAAGSHDDGQQARARALLAALRAQ